MRASGTVVAEIELPEAMRAVELDVMAVKPDVLVFDGPSSDTDDDDDDDNDDLPPRAFGHIHPDDFLDATSTLSTDPAHPRRLVVRAPMTDIPLDILPGRDAILRGFVSKLVFKGGAMAGISGGASVRVTLIGIDGKVMLSDLPVSGEVWVGRPKKKPFLVGDEEV